jgi:hypothetical protein
LQADHEPIPNDDDYDEEDDEDQYHINGKLDHSFIEPLLFASLTLELII